MKYFIGIPVPKNYKNKIEMLRAEYRFLTTEPHITLVPPTALPTDDSFIEEVVKACRSTKAITINLDNLERFNNLALYISLHSSELEILYDNICDKLHLQNEKTSYNPHLTVLKQRQNKQIDLEKIKTKIEKRLSPYPAYKLTSLVIYHQPKERFIYVPYMKIPLSDN
ncbi:MAG: 2'-5' RNA ligase family protein [Sedimentibacter sp.]